MDRGRCHNGNAKREGRESKGSRGRHANPVGVTTTQGPHTSALRGVFEKHEQLFLGNEVAFLVVAALDDACVRRTHDVLRWRPPKRYQCPVALCPSVVRTAARSRPRSVPPPPPPTPARGKRCARPCLHLHGLEHNERLVHLDGVAGLDKDLSCRAHPDARRAMSLAAFA